MSTTRFEMLNTPHESRNVLSELRKESLDLYNRVHSIAEDIEFVKHVRAAYPQLPILVNQRCGAWYVDPKMAKDEAAYFKSTDGHFNNWSFNLRRPNLHLLSVVTSEGGFLLVDSTRAGKRIPDALSKTVPIWCAVVNRTVQRKYPSPNKEKWDTRLYCAPGAVSAQEQAQIEAKLQPWVDMLFNSPYILTDLARPLRPFWVTSATTVLPNVPTGLSGEFHPIVCVSASKQMLDGLERRSGGFAYVQGSGDDHEMWGKGLSPQLFWTHKDAILQASRSDLPALVESLVSGSRQHRSKAEWTVRPTPILHTEDLIWIGAIEDLPSPPRSLPDRTASFIIITSSLSTQEPSHALEENILRLHMSEGKKDQLHYLQSVLPRSSAFIAKNLTKRCPVCICCETGRDVSVGIALMALQLFFNDSGQSVTTPEEQHALRNNANKQSISKRLQWIIASRPEANPSRVTLKRVNEYILSPPTFRKQRGAD